MSALLPLSFVDTAQEITARILNPNDANAFRAIRLEALKNEGLWFGAVYEDEKKRTPKEWAEACSETPEKAVFGLFHGQQMVGVMMARKFEEDQTGKTALWGAAYVQPEYRSRGLASALYKARMQWTQRHPNYDRAVLFIREGNEHSRDIHLKNGAKYIFTRQMEWPGRPASTWHWYEVPVAKAA